MKRIFSALLVTAALGSTALFAQGSGTTHTTTTTTKTTTATKSNYQTTHHVNGVVTARSKGSITVKTGSKSRRFNVVKGTSFVGTRGKTGSKVKVSYRSNAPKTATEIRLRG